MKSLEGKNGDYSPLCPQILAQGPAHNKCSKMSAPKMDGWMNVAGRLDGGWMAGWLDG